MKNINIAISGFKCFKQSSFDLKQITLLTGSNGTGKSSLIQSLLLTRLAIEKNASDPISDDFINTNWKNLAIPLNGYFELNLGSVFDIFNNSESAENEILLKLGDENFKIDLPESDENVNVVKFSKVDGFLPQPVPFWRKKEFYYLNTERLGPRLGLDTEFTEFIHCGYKGQNTGHILQNYGLKYRISDQRAHPEIKSQYLQQQVDAWLNEICPGTIGVSVNPQGINRTGITLKSSAVKREILAPNIGFGISYALPIIVNGLIAVKDAVFIIENPEAHLHPKGQSNIGFFLGAVAASGVRIIIETHSEHVVNGLRRASMTFDGLNPQDVGIYFFKASDAGTEIHQLVDISDSGDLTSFPKDFFDQVNQDISQIFKLKAKRKNG